MFFRMSVLLCCVGFVAACSSDESEGPFKGDGTVVADGAPRSMAAVNGDIYFADKSDGAPVISKYSPSNAEVSRVVGPLNSEVTEVVTDGVWLAWIESEDTVAHVYHMRISDSMPVSLLEDLKSPTIAVHNETLYVSEQTNGAVVSIPLTSGAPLALAENVGVVRAMATDDEYLYLAQAFDAPNGRIVRAKWKTGYQIVCMPVYQSGLLIGAPHI